MDRHRVFSAVAQLLAQAAAERGVVLVIDDLNAADEATVALVHHLARSAAGERLLVVAGMRDEPLPEAAAFVRSSLLERGAAVEVALGPLDRGALAAVAQRAAARPLRPGALGAIERSAAGNPFFAEELAASVDASGEVTVSPRLREVVARRLERLEPLGERLLAALAVIDDGFTSGELAALGGRRARRGGARRGPRRPACSSVRAAATASGTRSCEKSWPPGCRRSRCAAPTRMLPPCSPPTAPLLNGSPIICCAAGRAAGRRPAAHSGCRVGRGRGRLPRWRRVGRAGARARGRAGASGPPCAARAATPWGRRGPRARRLCRGDRGRARGAACPRCERNRRARASRRATSRAPRLRSKAYGPSGPKTSLS